jgi:hypothetical protein
VRAQFIEKFVPRFLRGRHLKGAIYNGHFGCQKQTRQDHCARRNRRVKIFLPSFVGDADRGY